MAYNPSNPNGQTDSANSQPVVIANDQTAVPVSAASLPLPSGAATAANQATEITSLASIVTNTSNTVTALNAALPAGTNEIGGVNITKLGGNAAATGSGVTTTGTQRVVLASDTPLPTGTNVIGSLSANQSINTAQVAGTSTSVNTGNADAGTQRVVIASNQPAFSVTTSGVADITATGTITTQNLVPAGVATAGSAVLSGSLNGVGALTIQVTGTYTGNLSIQATVDNSTWVTLSGTQSIINMNTGAYAAVIASAAQGIFQTQCGGFQQIRVTGLAAVTGTATVTLRASAAQSNVAITNPLPAGTAILGALTANQSVNVAQMNGTATLMGAGPTGAGSLRTTAGNTATATLANVASSATSVTLLAFAAVRLGASFYNDSTSVLFLKFGATASNTSYTVQIQPGGYYELPQPCYSGVIDGIWTTANGNCRVTSW